MYSGAKHIPLTNSMQDCSRCFQHNQSVFASTAGHIAGMQADDCVVDWRLPTSIYFTIRDTRSAGRAVFCTRAAIQRSLLLTTSAGLSPISHVILRPYSREVCAWCFLYDRGRDWRIREGVYNTAFCSEGCQQLWANSHDMLCRTAVSAIETFTKQRLKGQNGSTETTSIASAVNPASQTELQDFWDAIGDRGNEILSARKSNKLTKSQRAVLRKASELSPDTDILAYVLSGVLTAYKTSKSQNLTNTAITPEALLPSLFELMPDEQVFIDNPMTVSPLEDYAATYLILLTLLPAELLDLISTALVVNLASRAAHNAFSIRPEGVTDGEQSGEFLGWGVWPEASFFNHSCRPNVRKERHGRQWSFFADTTPCQTIEINQQLCITYLGGDEKDLDVHERRKRLQEQWGFWCQCERCVQEGGSV